MESLVYTGFLFITLPKSSGYFCFTGTDDVSPEYSAKSRHSIVIFLFTFNLFSSIEKNYLFRNFIRHTSTPSSIFQVRQATFIYIYQNPSKMIYWAINHGLAIISLPSLSSRQFKVHTIATSHVYLSTQSTSYSLGLFTFLFLLTGILSSSYSLSYPEDTLSFYSLYERYFLNP